MDPSEAHVFEPSPSAGATLIPSASIPSTASRAACDDRLAEVFDLAPSFLSILRGPHHVFERVNPAYLRLVGDRPLLGRSVREALPEVAEQGFVEILDGVYETGEPFIASELSVRLLRCGIDGGEERFVTFVYQPLRGPDAEIDGIVAHGVDVTDHVRARKEVAVREAHFRSLIENSDDKISVLSNDGTILYESPAGERLMGWSAEESLSTNALEFVHPDDRQTAQERMAQALESPGSPHRLEHRMRHRDGSWRTFETVAQARTVRGALELVTNSRDITSRREADAALREREERFRALVELIPQLVWATTPDGYHDYFNQRWYEYTGMAREGRQGWNWKDYLHPDDYERSLEVWHHSLATGEEYEVEYRFRRASDGAYRWFIGRAQPLHGEDGEIVRWFGTCTDVHDERMAREAATRNEERFQAATRATKDIVWDWDLSTDEMWRNENVATIFRIDAADLPVSREGWSRRIHPDDQESVLAGLASAMQGGEDTWSAEYRFIRGDDSVAYLLDRARVIRDASGTPVRVVGSTVDLTERTRLEEELRQAQKVEAIGKLAGGIAHDFNNLLTVIGNYAELLLGDLEAGHPSRDDVDEIRKAADRAASLTRQLLAFGRRQVLEPRSLDLNEVMANVEKMLRRLIGEDIQLIARPGDRLDPVLADPGQIEQVILNLAFNARDAMPKGGTFTLSTANEHLSEAAARMQPVGPGDYVVLSVEDTGCGMDAATRARAFDPFFTTKRVGEGTGLGLSTVHGIVTQSGGHIAVKSEPGGGAVFRIHLPVDPSSPRSERPATQQLRSPVGTGNILLVEDEDAVRRVTRRALRRYGYQVFEASDGLKALEVMNGLESNGIRIDLVVTDLVMPRMGGRELVERIRERPTSLPILFMSGYAESEMRPDGALEQGDRFLEKPFRRDQLLNAVAALTQRSG